MKKIFITGIAGMIGYHSAQKFKSLGWEVSGVDDFNDYYEVQLKRDREKLLNDVGITVTEADIQETDKFEHLLDKDTIMLHLAAYANPRHALDEPQPYIDTNITGTQRLTEMAERVGCNVVYASSSCVMHGQPLPWNETDCPGHQNNPYGWSKRANECQFKHSLIERTIGLRFFTVYGPWGRPDMALFKFTKAIVAGEPIDLYNYGDMKRDFTFVDDIVQGVVITVDKVLNDEGKSYDEIFNIGYGDCVQLMDFVTEIEKNMGKEAQKNLVEKHRADVPATWSDTSKLQALGYKPTTSIKDGIKAFCDWYKEYYGVK